MRALILHIIPLYIHIYVEHKQNHADFFFLLLYRFCTVLCSYLKVAIYTTYATMRFICAGLAYKSKPFFDRKKNKSGWIVALHAKPAAWRHRKPNDDFIVGHCEQCSATHIYEHQRPLCMCKQFVVVSFFLEHCFEALNIFSTFQFYAHHTYQK